MGALTVYLLFINIIGIVIVLLDYFSKIPRVSSIVLHIIEFFGGVILMLPTLYILRYRITKQSYSLVSFWTLTVWFFISYIKIGILG